MIKYLFPNLEKRSNEVELMDIPNSDEKELINTIKQFKIINLLFTRSRYLIKKHIIKDILKEPEKSYSFLDLGAGGCDISYWFYKKCKKYGLNVRITCLDSDIRVIKYAKNKFKSIKELKIIKGCAFELGKIGKFDYIFANHFLHHLPSEKIPFIISQISRHTKRIFLLNDLYRSNIFLFCQTIFCKIFFHKSFIYYDGRLSIKKGFLYNEMLDFVKDIKDNDLKIKIKKLYPSRIYLVS